MRLARIALILGLIGLGAAMYLCAYLSRIYSGGEPMWPNLSPKIAALLMTVPSFMAVLLGTFVLATRPDRSK